MLKKSLAHILIVIINWVFLRYLLKISTDKLDVRIEESYTGNAILIITAISVLSFIGMRIFLFVVRNRALQERTKIIVAVLITLAISSFSYLHYAAKYQNDVIANGRFRDGIALKVQKVDWIFGTQAKGLTLEEYLEVRKKVKRLPELPTDASSIGYYYEHDGFLFIRDYSFSLEYDLPKDQKVDTLQYKKEGFTKTRSFVLLKNKKKIKYIETQT